MVEQTEYAVFRFLDQNGYCHMVHDCVSGSSIMQYVKGNVKVSKQQLIGWLIQLSQQMEQYYKCEEEQAYGYVNPYAVIVADGDTILLLDYMAEENERLIKRMRKKKIRALFVRKEYHLSQCTERADDWYGFGKTMQFMLDKCLEEQSLGRREEKIFRRISKKCRKGDTPTIREWSELHKELRMAAEVQKREKTPMRIKVLGIAAVSILLLAGAAVLFQEKESRGFVETPVVQAREEEIEETSEEKSKGYLELGLMEYMELEDYRMSRESLKKAAADSPLAKDYLKITQYLEIGASNYYAKNELEEVLEHGKEEFQNMQREELEGKEFLYKMPFLLGYRLLDTSETWREVKRIGEELRDIEAWNDWKEVGNKEREVRYSLAEAYERLEEPESAIEEYEKLRESEYDEMRLESIYLKLEKLYNQTEQYEKAKEIRQKLEETYEIENEEEKATVEK